MVMEIYFFHRCSSFLPAQVWTGCSVSLPAHAGEQRRVRPCPGVCNRGAAAAGARSSPRRQPRSGRARLCHLPAARADTSASSNPKLVGFSPALPLPGQTAPLLAAGCPRRPPGPRELLPGRPAALPRAGHGTSARGRVFLWAQGDTPPNFAPPGFIYPPPRLPPSVSGSTSSGRRHGHRTTLPQAEGALTGDLPLPQLGSRSPPLPAAPLRQAPPGRGA